MVLAPRFRWTGIKKSLLPLLVCGMLGGTRLAAADNAANPPEAVEAPPTITTGYGVSGLVLWLAADSGVTLDKSGGVAALADKTGNFILTANSPSDEPTFVRNGLNGRPVLRFNGSQSLYSPDNFGGLLNRDMTIIVVASLTDPPGCEQYPLYLGQNSTPHANRALVCLNGKEFFDGQFVGCYGATRVKNTFIVSGASIDSTLTQGTFYQNGKLMAVGSVSDENKSQNRVASFADLSDGVTMGAATDPVCGWQGDIAEELVYDHQLTPTEMQFVWHYLSFKYGLHQIEPSSPTPTTEITSAPQPSSG